MTFKKLCLAVFAVTLFLAPVQALAQVETAAEYAIIVDANTGTVLLDKQADARMPTSSMSKVMTAYMVFEDIKNGHLSLDDTVLISEKAWRMGGSKMFIKVGDRVKVSDLVRGLVIQSGNDAAVALAEAVAGSEDAFAAAATARAKEIGLTNSNFVNASGWPDPNHYSTPRDLAVLAYRIKADYPELTKYFSEKEFTYNKIRQQNRDPLLGRLPGADGLKTGHTEIAGYGLIGTAEREGRKVIMVINGLKSEKERQEEGIRLMEWAFRNFETKQIIAKDEAIEKAPVWLGRAEEVPLVAAEDVQVLLPRARRNEMKLTVHYDGPIKAPVKKGDEVGRLQIEIPDQPATEVKLLAGADIERKGLFGRAKSRLEYMLTGAF